MRRISFNLTIDAILDRSKTVTRRIGWAFAKPGDRLLAVDKLRTKKARTLGVIEIVSVRDEPLSRMTEDVLYGFAETAAEGFARGPLSWPSEFVRMFCDAMKVTPDRVVRRIEFRYVEPEELERGKQEDR